MSENVIETVATLLTESVDVDVTIERYDEWRNTTDAAGPAAGCVCI